MKLHLPAAISLVFLSLVAEPSAWSQEPILSARQDQPVQDTAEVQIVPFPPSRITEAFNQSFNTVNESGKVIKSEEQLDEVTAEIDTLFAGIDLFLDDSTLVAFEGVGVRELDNLRAKADLYISSIQQVQDRLSDDANVAEDAIGRLGNLKERWGLTLDRRDEEEFPETRIARIRRTIVTIDSVRTLLQGNLDVILSQQDRLSDKRNSLEMLQDRISEQSAYLGERLFSRDMPGFFKDLASLRDSTLVSRHASLLKKSISSDTEIFRSRFLVPMIVISVLFVVLLALSFWYKTHFARLISIEKFELSEIQLTVVYSPLVSIVFIVSLLVRLLFPDLPPTFRSLNLAIMMIPMVIIVIRLYGSLARTWMITLVTIYILTFLYELVYYPDVILRIILMMISITALLLFIWLILKKPLLDRFKNSFLYQVYRIILAGFTLMLFAAIIGNLAGAFRMAEFFTLAAIQIAVLAIGIQVAVKVIDSLVFLVLASNTLQRLNVFREEFHTIYRKTINLFNFLIWVFFFVTAMNIFRVKDAFFEWGRGVLTKGWKIGAVDISPINILIFVFVIWLSIVVTRIVRHILEKDVFARVTTAKGVPSTIILLVRIALISGGFFLAAAAAGMKLTNLSIVLGAFSVGIGFGLQNIFNNMVSGLILAFERPIKVGDVVQVGELLGVVRSIGLRSSTVKSFDGAEVIVPNGNLISNEMINWTLSDSNRRMDIRVGVAYGTDPEVVVALIEEAAAEHRKVDRKPAPRGYFLGFGDSSLDFRLLAWTDIDNRLETESELNIAVNKKLKEAGIEIPFPQRDLHIRSDDTKKSNIKSKS